MSIKVYNSYCNIHIHCSSSFILRQFVQNVYPCIHHSLRKIWYFANRRSWMNRIFIQYILQNAKEIRDISRMQMENKLSYAITPSSGDPQQALMNNDLPYQTRNFIMKHNVRLDHSKSAYHAYILPSTNILISPLCSRFRRHFTHVP